MRHTHEQFGKRQIETISTNEVPTPILEALQRESINPENVKSVEVDNTIQRIDGRQFYKITLDDDRQVDIEFIGEGHIVQKLEFS